VTVIEKVQSPIFFFSKERERPVAEGSQAHGKTEPLASQLSCCRAGVGRSCKGNVFFFFNKQIILTNRSKVQGDGDESLVGLDSGQDSQNVDCMGMILL